LEKVFKVELPKETEIHPKDIETPDDVTHISFDNKRIFPFLPSSITGLFLLFFWGFGRVWNLNGILLDNLEAFQNLERRGKISPSTIEIQVSFSILGKKKERTVQKEDRKEERRRKRKRKRKHEENSCSSFDKDCLSSSINPFFFQRNQKDKREKALNLFHSRRRKRRG